MVKLVALFRRPPDPQAWMARYFTEHAPLMRRLPHLARVELSSPFDTMALPGRKTDRRGPPFLMAELYFADRSGFDHAMVSREGRQFMDDLQRFAGQEVSLFLAEVEDA